MTVVFTEAFNTRSDFTLGGREENRVLSGKELAKEFKEILEIP